jgi:hypothetical protein
MRLIWWIEHSGLPGAPPRVLDGSPVVNGQFGLGRN